MLSCSTAGTSRNSVSGPDFRAGNLPIREIQAVVLTSSSDKIPEIRELVRQGSDELTRQVGISITVCDWKSIEWKSRDRIETLRQVAREMEQYRKPYDIALAFLDFSAPQFLQYVTLGSWEGQIDDTWRRFIVIRRMTVQVLLHEICHGFLFSHLHSSGLRNLMTSTAVYVVPGVMPVNRSVYLLEEDRKEILVNKWRDFSIPPRLDPAHVVDTVASVAGTPSRPRAAQ